MQPHAMDGTSIAILSKPVAAVAATAAVTAAVAAVVTRLEIIACIVIDLVYTFLRWLTLCLFCF